MRERDNGYDDSPTEPHGNVRDLVRRQRIDHDELRLHTERELGRAEGKQDAVIRELRDGFNGLETALKLQTQQQSSDARSVVLALGILVVGVFLGSLAIVGRMTHLW